MPKPKKSKTPSNATVSSAAIYAKEELGPYAVVVADLLASRFDPLSAQTPPCLLPLANVPVIQFTLTRLIEDGFTQILVYACRLSSLVVDFISNLYPAPSGVNITVMNGEGSRSLGDVMRDLDSSQVLSGVLDFLLVPADLVCVPSLRPLFDTQQARRNRSPNAILSLVLPPRLPGIVSCAQTAEWGVTVAYSRTAGNRLIDLLPTSQTHCFSIPLLHLVRSDQLVEISSDLLDVGIAVCSSHVPPLFQDNFDYQDMHDLIHDILSNEEVIGYAIHVDRLPPGSMVLPAAPDLTSLMDTTIQVLSRQAGVNKLLLESKRLLNSPETGDSDWLQAVGPSVYIAQSSSLAPSVKLIGSCLIGPGCQIGPNSVLVDCVLSADCQIGANCRLRRSVFGSGVELADDVVTDTAWICDQARLLSGIRLPSQCFVGPPSSSCGIPVTLGPGKGMLPKRCVIISPKHGDLVLEPQVGGENVLAVFYQPNSKVQRAPSMTQTSSLSGGTLDNSEDFDEGSGDDDDGCRRGGTSREGDIWTTADERIRLSSKRFRQTRSGVGDDTRSSEQSQLISRRSHTRRSGRHSRASYGSLSQLSTGMGHHQQARAPSKATRSSEEEEEEEADEGERSEVFLIEELRHTLEHDVRSSEAKDNILLEINSLKHAYNIPLDDLYFLLVKALLDLSASMMPKETPSDLKVFVANLKEQTTRLGPVFQAYLSSCPSAGRLCLQAVEDTACYRDTVMQASPYVLHFFYDLDLVSEADIWWWLDNSPLLFDEDLAEATGRLRAQLTSFLDWLREAEEEDSSSS